MYLKSDQNLQDINFDVSHSYKLNLWHGIKRTQEYWLSEIIGQNVGGYQAQKFYIMW